MAVTDDRRHGDGGERGGNPVGPVGHRNSSRSERTSGSLLSRPLSRSPVTTNAVIA